MLQTGLGVEPRQLVGGALHLVRRQAEPLPQVAPAVRDQVVERFLDEPVDQRVGPLLALELQQQALPQVTGADPGRVELLDDAQHLLRRRVGGDIQVQLRLRLVLLEQLVRAFDDLLQARLEVPVLPDVAEELLGEQLLARREVEHPRLLAQIIDQILALDRDRLHVLGGPAQGAARHPVLGAVVHQDGFPVGFVVPRFLLLGGLLLGGGTFGLLLGLDHLEERIAQQLLLQVLLQVEQRHVEEIHRLVQARIDPQILAEPDVLVQAGLHAACVRRARRRAVRVGPRYRSDTRSSKTSSRTVPPTCTSPSNMMYARSTMSSVCSTLWSVISTPMPRCRSPATMVWMSCTAIGSTPANGSSSSMNFGSVTSERVISRRRRSPPESWKAFWRRRCLMASSSRTRSSRACRSASSRGSISRIARTFSSTVSLRKTDGSCAR